MESLESKLDRLSPEKRREAEDFVDFLLTRAGSPPGVFGTTTANPPILMSAPPVMPVVPPIIIQETPSFVAHEQNNRLAEPSSFRISEAHSSPLQEITKEVSDRISRDYMDYGQFDQQSPATEAVRNVKAKLIQKCGKDSSQLLDWID